MYKDHSICVVVPAFREENLISGMLSGLPAWVDRIVVVDDASPDQTAQLVEERMAKDERIVFIRHDTNQGVGGAIASGYKWARDNGMDIAVVMAGDGQMDPEDLPAILDPVAEGRADYSKGNRLFSGEAFKKIPRLRYFGNALLSLFTKIASGYWHIADSQSGYAAIGRRALELIGWDEMYKRYGQPNDILVRLNVNGCTVEDIHIQPVYNIGERSGIKIRKVVFTISWLLCKLFLWRMKEKYIIRDFHPLIFFYSLGFLFSVSTVSLFLRLLYYWFSNGHIPPINALAAMFCFMSASLFVVFAMWFDMEANRKTL